jgi:predicted DNA-binding helix-hairpin-helix protein
MAKLQTLVAGAGYDVCGYTAGPARSPTRFIHRAALPAGGSSPLFKVLLTNVCVNDCAYCVNQVGRDGPRHSFQPEELARLFMDLHRKRLVRGLFLSSGIGVNATRTMQSMIDTVDILRHRHEFGGYVHLKILPGASFDCVAEACKLASRVSVNMEAPTPQHLARLSSGKDLGQGIVERMRWVKQLTDAGAGLVPSGQTTQFVVGAAGETDRDILNAAQALYSEMQLRRVYFSGFRPVRGSRLECVRPALPMREHRLYQTDWLIRVYGFSPEEIGLALGQNGNLRLGADPKLSIARGQPWLFPVDVNRASYEELLRVPGIGPVSAGRMVESRREHSISSLQRLQKMGVATRRAAPYVWFPGIRTTAKQASFLPQLGPVCEQSPSLAGILG